MKQKTASRVQPRERKEELQVVSSSEEKKNIHILSVLSVFTERLDLRHWKCQWQRDVRPQKNNATVYEWGSKVVVVVGGCIFKGEMYFFCKRTKSNSELIRSDTRNVGVHHISHMLVSHHTTPIIELN